MRSLGVAFLSLFVVLASIGAAPPPANDDIAVDRQVTQDAIDAAGKNTTIRLVGTFQLDGTQIVIRDLKFTGLVRSIGISPDNAFAPGFRCADVTFTDGVAKNVVIERNLFANVIRGAQIFGDSHNVRIAHNVIQDVVPTGSSPGARVKNNVVADVWSAIFFFDSSLVTALNNTGTNVTSDYNFWTNSSGNTAILEPGQTCNDDGVGNTVGGTVTCTSGADGS